MLHNEYGPAIIHPDGKVLKQQVDRMIADPRSQALVRNFTGQWLNVRGIVASEPVVNLYPDFDSTLRDAFRREIELFFASIIQEDRGVDDLLTADYTFVNERLARHYGIPGIYGPQFRRVQLGADQDMRKGLLGKGALLTITSDAERTTPVRRGKWYLQTYFGVTPPDPPPGVETKLEDKVGELPKTMRERLLVHSTNPSCASCHQSFEPMGLAMENFDAVGRWRTIEVGTAIDPLGITTDGTRIEGISGLRALVKPERRDLMTEAAPAAGLQVIACRNMLIYIDRASQEPLLRRFHEALVPGGFLVLGKVETLMGPMRALFETVDQKNRIFRRSPNS
jgi:hypothetical protein